WCQYFENKINQIWPKSDKGIISISTNGTSIRKKLGQLISPSHGIHVLHSSIRDSIHKKQPDVRETEIESEDEDKNNDISFEMNEISSTVSKDDDTYCSISRRETGLDAEYVVIT
ncbi:hypothetical protein HHI36_005089, partial [Cryptolaemus montrouzieri]